MMILKMHCAGIKDQIPRYCNAEWQANRCKRQGFMLLR